MSAYKQFTSKDVIITPFSVGKKYAYTGNERYYVLRPNITSAENTTYSDNWQMDFLSNGFKLRTTAGHLNSGNLIYMAFAESPFTTSTGIPTTAM